MTKDNTEQREGLQQQAQKLRKQKTRQMIVSLIGIAILLFGLIKVILIFINYATTESSNEAQIDNGNGVGGVQLQLVYLSGKPKSLRIYKEDLFPGASESKEGRYPACTGRP